MSPAEEKLRSLADRVEAQDQIIEALAERLSRRAPDPDGLRSASATIQGSRAYRFAVILDRWLNPLRGVETCPWPRPVTPHGQSASFFNRSGRRLASEPGPARSCNVRRGPGELPDVFRSV